MSKGTQKTKPQFKLPADLRHSKSITKSELKLPPDIGLKQDVFKIAFKN